MKYLNTLLTFSIANSRLLLLFSVLLGVVIFEGVSVSLIIPLILGKLQADNSFINVILNYLTHIFQIEGKEYLIIIVIIFSILLRQTFIFFKDYLLGITQAESLESLRIKVLTIILRSKMQVFITKHIGEFTNLAFQATLLSSNLIFVSVNIIFHYFLTFVYIAILLFFAKEVGLALIIIAFIYQVSLIKLNKISMNVGTRVKNNNQTLFNIISDYVKCIKLIKIRNFEENIIDKISLRFNDLTKNSIKFETIKALIKSVSPIILIFLFAILIIILKLESRIDAILLGVIVVLLIRIQQTLTQINSDKASYFNFLPSMNYINEFIKENNYEFSESQVRSKKIKFNDSIKFNNVSFAYNADSKIKNLDNISLEIKKNKVTGIIGPSGSGKSTIIELLLMNYKPSQGKICIDSVSLDQEIMQSYREKIGYVSQENLIFNNSIKYNLNFGINRDLTSDEISSILEVVDLKNDLNKYDKNLDYNLGESGNRLSGGQKQRLSLARALLINPEILILDEPTSALDKKTEKIIIKNIKKLRGSITVVLISHNKDIINICDQIYYIDSGKILK